MKAKVIKTKADYEAAFARIEKLMDALPNTPQGDELELLSLLVHNYEEKKFPIDKPDPIAAIRFGMEQQGLEPKDLVPLLGSRSRVSEVLSGRRGLSLKMIRALMVDLRIPAEVLLGEIYGEFTTNLQLAASTYRSEGLPKGVQLQKLNRTQRPVFPFTDGDFAKTAGRDNPTTLAKIQKSPECVIIQGEVADPQDLDYLRDSIGIATWFLDNGGVAIMDPQQLKLYAPEFWRKEIFEPVPPRLSQHVVILISKESDGTKWFHTRGLRKFGRPDVSFHNMPAAQEEAVVDLFNRFIILQAEGGRVPEGQEIRMASLPQGLKCHHEDTFDDLDFNNVHIEVQAAH